MRFQQVDLRPYTAHICDEDQLKHHAPKREGYSCAEQHDERGSAPLARRGVIGREQHCAADQQDRRDPVQPEDNEARRTPSGKVATRGRREAEGTADSPEQMQQRKRNAPCDRSPDRPAPLAAAELDFPHTAAKC